MFDISWTEFLLIGVVALIVIGPKELPGVLRAVGQWTRKVRSMAAEFQNQFHEAMREAEMADLKKEVDSMAHDFKNFDPLKDVRSDVESMGKDLNKDLSNDLERSLEAAPQPKPAASEPVGEVAALPAVEPPLVLEPPEVRETAADVATGAEAKAPMATAETSAGGAPSAEHSAASDSAGRSA